METHTPYIYRAHRHTGIVSTHTGKPKVAVGFTGELLCLKVGAWLQVSARDQELSPVKLQAWGMALPEIPRQEGRLETPKIRPAVGLLVKANWNIHWSSPDPLPPLPRLPLTNLDTSAWA